MARPVNTVDYRTLAITTVRKKYAAFFLGLAVVFAVILTGYYIYIMSFNRINNPAKPAKKSAAGETLKKITPVHTQGQIGQGIMTGKVTHTSDTYTVQPGDTLSVIAEKVYGDADAWVKIAQVNNISDPNNVTEGTLLKIPR